MDYNSPAAGMTPASTFAQMPGAGFWTGYTQGQDTTQMAPFRANDLATQQLALQKAQMQMGEFQSPTAVAARQSALQAQTAQNQGTVAQQPSLNAQQIAAHEAFVAQQPSATQLKIAQNANQYNAVKGSDAQGVYDGIASIATSIHDAPDAMKPALWDQQMQIIKATHPNTPIPPGMDQWTPENEQQAQNMFTGKIHSIAEQQKLEELRQQGMNQYNAAALRANATLGAGQARAGATIQASENMANSRAMKPETQAEQVARYRTALAQGPSNPSYAEAQEGMKSVVSAQIQKDPQIAANATARSLAMMTGKDTTALDKADAAIKDRIYSEHGIKPDGTTQGGVITPKVAPTSVKPNAGEKLYTDKNNNKAVLRNGVYYPVQ